LAGEFNIHINLNYTILEPGSAVADEAGWSWGVCRQ